MNLQEKLDYANSSLSAIGLNETQRAGVIGSLMGESGRTLNTSALGDGGRSFGISQVNGDRRTGLESFAAAAGRALNDFRTQMDYVVHELTTTEKKALDAVKGATTLEAATRAFTNKFERPNQAYANHTGRYNHATYAFSAITGRQPANLATYDPTKGVASAQKSPGVMGAVETVLNSALGIKSADPSVNQASAGAKGGLAGLVGNFMGDVNMGGKLGAVAGGIFGGPQGAVMGGLVGQGLGMMLGGLTTAMAKSAQSAAGPSWAGNKDYFPDRPAAASNERGSDPRESAAYERSGQFRDAVDSGKGGLW